MGRLLNETAVTTLVSGDKILVDNLTLGTRQINYSDLSTQMEIVARKGAVNGYASLDSSGKVPAAQISSPYTIEAAANAAARDALTVTTPQIGVRQVRLTDTGVIYVPNAAGSGAGIWMVFNSVGVASTSAPGILQIADSTEAETDNTMALTIAESLRRNAPYRNALAPAQALSLSSAGATIGSTVNLGATGSTIAFTYTPKTIQGGYLFNSTNETSIIVYQSATGSIWWISNGSITAQTPDGTLVANVPVACAITRDGTTCRIYVNGVLAASGADTATIASPLTVFGSSNFVGNLRLIGFYNRQLSAAEVLALYQIGVVAAGDIYGSGVGTTITAGAFVVGKKYRLSAPPLRPSVSSSQRRVSARAPARQPPSAHSSPPRPTRRAQVLSGWTYPAIAHTSSSRLPASRGRFRPRSKS
jgi:hypothetical protein